MIYEGGQWLITRGSKCSDSYEGEGCIYPYQALGPELGRADPPAYEMAAGEWIQCVRVCSFPFILLSLALLMHDRYVEDSFDGKPQFDAQALIKELDVTTGEPGKLGYWTPEMCTVKPGRFDFVITVPSLPGYLAGCGADTHSWAEMERFSTPAGYSKMSSLPSSHSLSALSAS